MTTSISHKRLFCLIWLSGLPGIAAVTWLVLPGLVAGRSLPVPVWVLQIASTAQSAILLAAASAAGAFLAHRVNLSAPFYSAITTGMARRGFVECIRVQVLPGVVGGVLGAVVLWIFSLATPELLRQVAANFPMPAVARLLYGGITEELVLRWGLMTLVLWLLWRFVQRGVGIPSAPLAYAAIMASAVLFGVGHLPAVSAMIGHIPPGIALYIVAANTSFGLIAGWLYWRFGLEAAIVAHATVHLLMLAFAA